MTVKRGRLISREYAALNSQMHAEQDGYGTGGWRYVGPVLRLMARRGCRSLLDYGCGKGSLIDWMPEDVSAWGYDPAVPAYARDPAPADFVSCLDVLEHVEPERLDRVLEHIREKMMVAGLLVISVRPANKSLPDGRNAHLIIHDRPWWLEVLRARWPMVVEAALDKNALCVYVEC